MSIVRPKFFWPLTITTSNRGIRINNGVTDATVNIATGTYYSAEALRAAVETAVAGHCVGMRVLLSVYMKTTGANYATDRSGKFVFDWGGASFSLLAGHVAFTSYALLGFNALTYNSGSTSVYVQRNGTTENLTTAIVVGSTQHQNGWYPEHPPSSDSLTVRDRGMHVTSRSVAGATKTLAEVELGERRWNFRFLEPHKTYEDFESTGTRTYEALERLWASGYDRFRYFPSEISESGYEDFVLEQDTMRRFEPTRQFPKRALYEFELRAWSYV